MGKIIVTIIGLLIIFGSVSLFVSLVYEAFRKKLGLIPPAQTV